ncbi:MAG: hypothetical protein E7Z93_00110 [Cyanobacteria bacterium SIG32]|nr:hypothetical protein [Cyanobacteria bacterium SIG32]
MEYILDILYIYVAVYSIYFLALALRNLCDKPFRTEKKYSQYEDKENLAVVIYSHNNKASLEALIEQFKMQDYPIDCFRVYAILDNCTDGSEIIFQNNRFVNVVNFTGNTTLGKDQAVSLLLQQLAQDGWIGSYIFIDGNRGISNDFLSTVNSALVRNSVLGGETIVPTDNLDIIDSIKVTYQKYHMNFIRRARSLFGLAAQADSGLFIIKKEIVDSIGAVDFKDIDSELKYSLLLSKIGFKCTYNPNIQTVVSPDAYEFRRPRISQRITLFANCIKKIFTPNFVFVEHAFSLIAPNFWLLVLIYLGLMKHSYKYYFFVDFKFVLLTFIILLVGFGISIINSKLSLKELGLLFLYPIYSIGHIIKNLPPVRKMILKCTEGRVNEKEKLSIDVVVFTGKTDLPCKLEFISDKELSKVRFIFKNKKYTTSGYLRMVDALQELKSKLEDYGFILKICSCCSHFTSYVDGSKNMLKGYCSCNYPSPSIKEPKSTLIWNSCSQFSPARLNNLIEEMISNGKND